MSARRPHRPLESGALPAPPEPQPVAAAFSGTGSSSGPCYLSAGLVVLPLGFILWHLITRGAPGLSIEFFTRMPTPVREPGGGMANAIVGTLMLGEPRRRDRGSGRSRGRDLPRGVRKREVCRHVVRYTAELLSGVPSIVVGVAAYGLVVEPMGNFSALAGGGARDPHAPDRDPLHRGDDPARAPVVPAWRALALGLRWKVIQQVVLPAARSGIITASMLAVARAAVNRAWLLFTALGNRFWSTSLVEPIASLPIYIFDYARSYEDWNRQAGRPWCSSSS